MKVKREQPIAIKMRRELQRNAVNSALDWESVTPFQRKVYEATMRVPPGKVTTYRLLGEAIGCRSPRAIGQALRRNPFAPVVPCHRVIASSGMIGGFAGRRAGAKIAEKKALLHAEGIRFTGGDGRLEEPSRRLYRFE